MADLICIKSMSPCQTPSMCSPYGGCNNEHGSAELQQLQQAVIAARERQVDKLLNQHLEDVASIETLRREVSELQHKNSAGVAREWDLRSQIKEARDSRASCAESNSRLRLQRDRLKSENERLRNQVIVLQSDANSWQSGYNEGRRMGTKSAQPFSKSVENEPAVSKEVGP